MHGDHPDPMVDDLLVPRVRIGRPILAAWLLALATNC